MVSVRQHQLVAARAELERAQGERRAAEARVRMIEQRIEKLRRTPNEPVGEGAIVSFAIRFNPPGFGSQQVYRYAAIRSRSRWFTTGSSCPANGYSWGELCAFIDEHVVFEPLAVLKTSNRLTAALLEGIQS